MEGQAVVNEEIRRQIMDHMGRLEVAFRELDPEGKGYISHLDFRKALYIHCGLPYSAVGVLMGDVPSAGGMVDYTKWVTEFVANSRKTTGLTREYIRTHDELLTEMQAAIRSKFADVHGAFRTFDTNGDGLISLYEFKRALYLHLGVLPSHMDALFRYIDTNDSGYINYDEWLQFFASDFNAQPGGSGAGGPISPLRKRVLQREMQRAGTTPSSVPLLPGNAVPQSTYNDRTSILGMLDAKRAEGEIGVAPLRQMQLVDEIRALNLAPGKQVEFLRDLPVSTEKKVQVFRELQLSPVYESKFLADIRAMDYLRASLKTGGDKRGLEGLFVSPTREVALINDIRRTPLSGNRKLGLLRDLPLSTSKKLDLAHELRLVEYIDDVYRERAR
jgi:Ca2+-binding EF-hand superfamily protein